jgi:hypothetical protein
MVHGVVEGNQLTFDRPARTVSGKDGYGYQQFFFQELMNTLEKIQPGVSSYV